MKRVYYEKVGRRYKPVREYDSDVFGALPLGSHLIICRPGVKSTRHDIEPALAPMIAAGRLAEDQMADAIVKASEMRPQKQPITVEQQEAWENLARAFGDEVCTLQHGSARDIVDAGVNALIAEAEKLMTNPAVKSAYDQFLLVCALTKENQ